MKFKQFWYRFRYGNAVSVANDSWHLKYKNKHLHVSGISKQGYALHKRFLVLDGLPQLDTAQFATYCRSGVLTPVVRQFVMDENNRIIVETTMRLVADNIARIMTDQETLTLENYLSEDKNK